MLYEYIRYLPGCVCHLFMVPCVPLSGCVCVLPVYSVLSSEYLWLDVLGAYVHHGLHAPWPTCTGCWSAVLCAVCWSAVLCAVLPGCVCVLHPSVAFSVHYLPQVVSALCLDVFVAYMVCFVVCVPLSEGVGHLCVVCFVSLMLGTGGVAGG